jgi:hypothetical protein
MKRETMYVEDLEDGQDPDTGRPCTVARLRLPDGTYLRRPIYQDEEGSSVVDTYYEGVVYGLQDDSGELEPMEV